MSFFQTAKRIAVDVGAALLAATIATFVVVVVLALVGASEGVTSSTASIVHTVAFWITLFCRE